MKILKKIILLSYRMTVKEQSDTQGDDLEQTVKDGVNDKLPIGDVALH